jgi:hypothetical protein
MFGPQVNELVQSGDHLVSVRKEYKIIINLDI